MVRLPNPETLAEKVKLGNRAALARAITLVESTRADHHVMASTVLDKLADAPTNAIRVGVSGTPGVGKSTFLDRFGSILTTKGYKVAVLAVDPSSVRTGGSILGDKTRMARLALDDNAFIRPSPSSGTLGGVASKTRDTMLLCEAAGFDVILVETMGVGQAEVKVAEMVDLVLLLMIAGGGDELQGIKKGILEVADIIAVNKADGANKSIAGMAASEIRAAMNILSPRSADWRVPVSTISGLSGAGLEELWQEIERFVAIHKKSGSIAKKREDQRVEWLWASLEEAIHRRYLSGPAFEQEIAEAEKAVRLGGRTPSAEAEALLDRLATTSRREPPGG